MDAEKNKGVRHGLECNRCDCHNVAMVAITRADQISQAKSFALHQLVQTLDFAEIECSTASLSRPIQLVHLAAAPEPTPCRNRRMKTKHDCRRVVSRPDE